MSSFSLKAAFLALLSVSVARAQEEPTPDVCASSRNEAFDYEVITSGPTIRWAMDTEAGTIDFQMEASAEAWTSLAFSTDFNMAGSDAVAGLPDDLAVLEYDLQGYDIETEVIPYETSDITNGVVSQENGQTTLSFTRALTPEAAGKQVISSTPGDLTIILWAIGQDNTWGYHGPEPNRWGVLVDLFCGEGATNGTVAETPAPTMMGDDMTNGTIAETPAPTMMGDDMTNGTVAETPAPSVMGDVVTTVPTAAPTMMPLAEGETMAPVMTPSPSAGGGGGGVVGGGGDAMTPAPAPGSRSLTTGPTSAPTSTEDGEAEGDASGAARVGGGSWAAMAAAGAMTVLAALTL